MANKVHEGLCRLCLTQGPLMDSHIIPKFHYQPIKEKDGLFYILSTDPQQKELKKQKGLTERLLCSQCEGKFSKYEDHLARVIFGGYPLDGQQHNRVLEIRGYDYQKVKNGLLSILWRMNITNLSYFEEVQLGAKHSENLRQALLLDSMVGEEEYPILLTAPFFEGKFLGPLILPPDSTRVGHNRVYRCLLSGLLFTFFIGSTPLDGNFRQVILRKAAWPVLKARVEEIPFLLDACIRIGKAQAIRATQ